MRRDFLIGSLLVLVTVAVFSPALSAGFVQWDDDLNIYNNPHIQKFSGENLKWMFTDCSLMRRYVPLSWLTWAITAQFFGLNPFFFHLEGLLFQAANAVLFFLLLKKILRRWSKSEENAENSISICAALAALGWAIHPMRAEVVAWANCQMYGQSLFFLLLSLWFYFRALEGPPGASSRPRWFSTIFFAASLLTYPTGVGFVVVLLALDIYLFARLAPSPAKWWSESRPVLLEKIPFVLVTLAVASVTLLARARMSGFWTESVDMGHFSWPARISQAFYIWAYYLWRPFWPLDLSPVYTRLIVFEPTQWPFLLSGALMIGGTTFLFLKRNRWPLLFALWICHLALLVPMLGLTEHPHYSNDRYNYISSLLWSILIAFVLAKIWNHKSGALMVAACVALVTIFSLLSFQQTQIWKNSPVLFHSIIARLGDHPYRARFYWRLGNYFAALHQTKEAVANYSEALKIQPAFAEVQNNLAAIYLGQGKFDDAIAQYESILKNNSRSALAHYNLGNVFEQQGKIDDAVLHYRAAIDIEPKNAEAQNNFGIVLARAGKMDEALEHILTAVRLDPNSAKAHYAAGTALMQQQKFTEAIEHFSAAVKLQPDFAEAHSNLGMSLATADHVPEALPHFAKVVQSKPKTPEVYIPLGMALAQLGKMDEAIKTYRQALVLAEANGNKDLAAQIQARLQELNR